MTRTVKVGDTTINNAGGLKALRHKRENERHRRQVIAATERALRVAEVGAIDMLMEENPERDIDTAAEHAVRVGRGVVERRMMRQCELAGLDRRVAQAFAVELTMAAGGG